MKKNPEGWNLILLQYDSETGKTYIVCGNERLFYEIPGAWTPETMLDGLKKLQEKEE